jgi:hypothetical protein
MNLHCAQASMRRAMAAEAAALQARQRNPTRLLLGGKDGSSRKADFKTLSLKQNQITSRLQLELNVLLETAQDAGINLLRVNVWETALTDSTVEVSMCTRERCLDNPWMTPS